MPPRVQSSREAPSNAAAGGKGHAATAAISLTLNRRDQEKREREKEAEKTRQDKNYLHDYWNDQLYDEENLENYKNKKKIIKILMIYT